MDELTPFTTSVLTVMGMLAFMDMRNPSANSTSWTPVPVMFTDCPANGVRTLLVSIVFRPMAMYSPSMLVIFTRRTVESVLCWLLDTPQRSQLDQSWYSRVNALNTLHYNPRLSVRRQLSNERIISCNTVLIKRCLGDRQLYLSSNKICCSIC